MLAIIHFLTCLIVYSSFGLCRQCIPSQKGMTALILGQDYYSIGNYTKAYDSQPYGVMAYTALASAETGALKGLRDPIDYGTGIEWASGLMNRYPNASLQLGLWLVDGLDRVVEGSLDHQISDLINYLTIDLANREVYLRIGYEFDWPANSYDPEKYINAFQYIVKQFRTSPLPTNHINFVWHSSGFQLFQGGVKVSFTDYYPGKEYVDICGTSLFQQPYSCQDPYDCRMDYVEDIAEFCAHDDIPFIICESTPIGGLIDEAHSDRINESNFTGSSWSKWFLPVLSLIQRRDIRLWSYINCDWDSQFMYRYGSWGDTRLQKFRGISKRWQVEVLESDRFAWYAGSNPAVTCDEAEHQKRKSLLPVPAHNFWVISAIFLVFLLIMGALCTPCLHSCAPFGHRRLGYHSIEEREMLVTDL